MAIPLCCTNILIDDISMGMGMKEMVKAFIGGIIFTLILVIVIPVITSVYIQPIVEDEVNSLGIAIISTSMMVSVIMLIIKLCFGYLLGGGAILRNFGIIGIFGLIFAYWLLGNPYGAVLPVLTLILIWFVKQIWDFAKGKTKEQKKREKKRKERRKRKK